MIQHHIEIEEYASQRVVHTTIKGTMSHEERDRVAAETVRKMRESSVSKAIWDLREAKLGYSLIGSHQVVLNLPALGLAKDDYVAVVYAQDREQHEHAGTAAYNRGIINIGYFLDIKVAIEWLIRKR